jgi:hypothetical protein
MRKAWFSGGRFPSTSARVVRMMSVAMAAIYIFPQPVFGLPEYFYGN